MTVSLDELGKIAYKAYLGVFNPQAIANAENEWKSKSADNKTAWIAAAVAVVKVPYSELNHLQAYRVVTVRHCARCDKDHEMNLKQFQGEPVTDTDPDGFPIFYNFWGLCPNTGDPVLMTIKPADKG